MKRREFISRLAGVAAAWPLGVNAQQTKKIPRLCFLTFDPGSSQSIRFKPFFEGLIDLGYVDGRTIAIEFLSAEGQGDRFADLAGQCVRLNADVIVVASTPAAHAATRATRTIPIVMLGLGDPIGAGLVESLARPGGSVTGITGMAPVVGAKRLELMKELVPRASRFLVLAHLSDPIATAQVKAMEEVAQALGVQLDVRNIRTAEDLPGAFEMQGKGPVDGVLVGAESIFTVNQAQIITLAARH